MNVRYQPLGQAKQLTKDWQITSSAFEGGHSAVIYVENNFLGIVGEPSARMKAALKLPDDCSVSELDISIIQKLAGVANYRPLNRFPSLDQDLCLRSSSQMTYAELTEFLSQEINKISKEHGYSFNVEPLDIFQRLNDKSHKQTTWRITLWHPGRTLTTTEVNKLMNKISRSAKTKLGAERI